MSQAPFGSSGAATVDRVLGNAYAIVKEVQENLTTIAAVALIADDITQVIENLNDVESTLAALLAGTTGAAQIGTAAEGTVQQALALRPLSTLLAGLTGASLIGTSDAGVDVEEALAARVKTSVLAADAGAAGVGVAVAWADTVEQALGRLIPVFGTDVQLQDITHASNTTGKFIGRFAFCTTDNKLYIAQAASNVGVWRSADGVDELNPA